MWEMKVPLGTFKYHAALKWVLTRTNGKVSHLPKGDATRTTMFRAGEAVRCGGSLRCRNCRTPTGVTIRAALA